MYKYNFDEYIERSNTNSIKYDFSSERGKPKDLLPMWVADMDFKAPVEVIDALVHKSKHGIYGYSESKKEYYEIIRDWYLTHFNYKIRRGTIIKTPGVVYAVAQAIKAYTKESESVLIQEPVYYPFKEVITTNNRNVVVNQLLYKNNTYRIDFDLFEKQIINQKVKVFILCNPHNPVGRVYTKEELNKLASICLKHNVIVLSDEIHADFIYSNHKHTMFASLNKEIEAITITLTSPSKTFNLASLQLANIFISNKKLRDLFKQEIVKTGYSQVSIMGIESTKAAYKYGESYVKQLTSYLQSNIDYIEQFSSTNFKDITIIKPEGTYLVWIDCNTFKKNNNLTDKQLDDFIIHQSKLWLDDGNMFGLGGSGFQRINIACPINTIKQSMNQLYNAVKEHYPNSIY